MDFDPQHGKYIQEGARYFCRKLKAAGVDTELEELIGDFSLIYVKCMESFNPDKGVKFKTYLFTAFGNHYKNMIRDARYRTERLNPLPGDIGEPGEFDQFVPFLDRPATTIMVKRISRQSRTDRHSDPATIRGAFVFGLIYLTLEIYAAKASTIKRFPLGMRSYSIAETLEAMETDCLDDRISLAEDIDFHEHDVCPYLFEWLAGLPIGKLRRLDTKHTQKRRVIAASSLFYAALRETLTSR